MRKCFSIGNIVLSDLYQNQEMVRTNALGGMNYRFLLAQSLFSQSCDYLGYLSNSDQMKHVIEVLSEHGCQLAAAKFVDPEQTIKFEWYFKNRQLDRLSFVNQDKMEEIMKLVKPGLIKNYTHINLCALGFDNEKKILSMIDSSHQTTSYIFHESNLNMGKPDQYLDLFPQFDYIFLNNKEAVGLTQADNLDLALSDLVKFDSTFFVTAGADGAYYLADGKIVHAAVSQVPVINTAGAGDTFAGGVMAAVRAGNSLDFAIRQGLLLSAVSVTGYLTEKLDNLLFSERKDNQ